MSLLPFPGLSVVEGTFYLFFQTACWAYEQVSNAQAHVWVLGKETRPIGTYWRNLFPGDPRDLPRAAD